MSRRTHALLTLLLTLAVAVPSRAQVPPAEEQIAGAVLALPEELRDGAAVLGYDADGNLITLREGTNDMICLANDPNAERFHVACYQDAMEPFMARGRELRAEGKTRGDVMQIREEEARAGTIKMPDHPSTLYVLDGTSATYAGGMVSVADSAARWVVYVPYATPETTGLPTKPFGPGTPWLMDAGKPWAHIMITPPRK